MGGDDSEGLADIQRSLEVGLIGVHGRLDVIIERLDHHGRRVDQHEEKIGALDSRLDTVEKTAVTRQDMEARAKRTINIVAVVMTGIGILIATLTAVVLALAT